MQTEFWFLLEVLDMLSYSFLYKEIHIFHFPKNETSLI